MGERQLLGCRDQDRSVAERLVDAADLHAGWRVLDVATGDGNAAIAAARRGCEASAIDYVPGLVERGRLRAGVEGLDVTLLEGDAEALAFPDASFDAVTSVFGVMFAANQPRAAAELLRVMPARRHDCSRELDAHRIYRRDVPDDGRARPSPAGAPSPFRWGTEEGLTELLGDGVSSLDVQEQTYTFRFTSAEEFVELLPHLVRTDAQGLRQPRSPRASRRSSRDLVDLARRHDRGPEGSLAVDATYLEAIAIRS